MKKKFLAILLLTATLIISGCGQVKIGYIDGERVMETPQIKSVLDEGETKMQEAQTQLSTELAAKQNATDEEKQKLQLEAQRKLMGIQQAYASQVRQKLDAALAEIVNQKSLDAVVEHSDNQKMVFEGGIDITEEVTKKLQ